MKEVIIKSKIVGKEGAIGGGKPIAFPDMSAYALRSDFIRLESSFNDFLEGDDTDNVINRWKELEAFLNNISEDYNLLSLLNGKADKATTLSGYGITDAYTKTNVDDLLLSYVTLGGKQTITGEKNFTGGLKVNGSPIVYDSIKKYWKLEGDLLVTGGVTMYGNEGTFTPSTIMDAIAVDGTTISKSGGVLKVIGGTGGGGLDITALQNYLTQNSYLNVAEGDGRYLKLSGGTISNNGYALILNRESENPVWIQFRMQNEFVGAIGGENGALRFMDKNSKVNTVWHSGNFTPSDYLPLSGGTLTDGLTISAGNLIVSGSDTVTNSLYPTKDKQYTLGNSSRYWSDIYTKLINGGTPWTSANDGSGSGLDADLLDGFHSSSFVRQYGISQNANEALNVGTYRFHETRNGLPDGATNYGVLFTAREDGYDTLWQLYGNYNNDGLFFRRGNNTGISENSWKQIAFTDSNVASATKLQTARTIWGKSFDGTGNIDGDFTQTKGGSYGGAYGNNSFYIYNRATSDVQGRAGVLRWAFNDYSVFKRLDILGEDIGTTTTIASFLDNGNVGVGTANPLYNFHVVGNSYIQGVSYVANYISFDYKDHSINNESAGRLGTFDRRGGMVLQFGTNTSNRRFSIIDQQWTVELFSVDDSGNVFANGGITMYSDQRKKTILNHVELSLKQIAEAPLIEHYYNSDEKKTTHVGSIAQYWANMNDWFCKLDSEGYYTMEIQNAALASAISIARELDRYETKTDKTIKKLKKRICELEEEVERLKSA